MTENVIPGMDDPEKYGIQDPEAPGEPDYWAHPPSEPVPGTRTESLGRLHGDHAGHHETTEGTGHETSRGGRD